MPRQRIISFRPSPNHPPRIIIEQILTGFIQRLDYMISRHSQVSVCHLTVTLPVKSAIAATIIGQSISLLRRRLKLLGTESQAGWVRETASNEKEHFHVGFMWNSTKFQSTVTIKALLVKILAETMNKPNCNINVNINPPNPLFDRQFALNLCSNKTIKIRRDAKGADEQRVNIISWLSYLAKIESKGAHQEKHIREFGFSLFNRKG